MDLMNAARASDAKGHRPELRVLVGSSGLRFLALDRPAKIIKHRDAMAITQAEFTRRLGLKPADWTVTIANTSRRQIFACAQRTAALDQIRTWAEASGHRLVSVRPWLMSMPFATASACALLEADAVSLMSEELAGGSGNLQMVSLASAIANAELALERLQINANLGTALVKRFRLVEHQDVKTLREDFQDLLVEERIG